VDKPDLYDPKINRSYAELAAHNGAATPHASAAWHTIQALAPHSSADQVSSWNTCASKVRA